MVFRRREARDGADAHGRLRRTGAQLAGNVTDAVVHHEQLAGGGNSLAQGQPLFVFADTDNGGAPFRRHPLGQAEDRAQPWRHARADGPAVRSVECGDREPPGGGASDPACLGGVRGHQVGRQRAQRGDDLGPGAQVAQWMNPPLQAPQRDIGNSGCRELFRDRTVPPSSTVAWCPRSIMARARSRTWMLAPPTASARVMR